MAQLGELCSWRLQKDSSVGEGKLNKAGEESLMPAGKYIGVNCSCPQSGDSVSRLPGLVSVFNSCRDTLGHRLGDWVYWGTLGTVHGMRYSTDLFQMYISCLGTIYCKTIYFPLNIFNTIKNQLTGLPWWFSGEETTCQCRTHGFDPWFRKISQLSPCTTTIGPLL